MFDRTICRPRPLYIILYTNRLLILSTNISTTVLASLPACSHRVHKLRRVYKMLDFQRRTIPISMMLYVFAAVHDSLARQPLDYTCPGLLPRAVSDRCTTHDPDITLEMHYSSPANIDFAQSSGDKHYVCHFRHAGFVVDSQAPTPKFGHWSGAEACSMR